MQWVMGIVGVVLLGVLADVVLPAGQMHKYVKGIFTVLLVVALVSALVGMIRQQSALSLVDNLTGEGYQTDVDYIQIVDNDSLLRRVQSRFPTVVRLARSGDGWAVYVEGTPPAGLAQYVGLLSGVDSGEVRVYGTDD